MSSLTDRQLARVSTVLLDEVLAFAPDWIDRNESDPGVVLLELFAFLTEGLLFRQGTLPPRGAEVATRLARAARALTGAGALPAGRALRRVNYFGGQLLGEADFRDEQDYFRARLRRRNRFLLGSGVVSGLEASIAPAGGGTRGQVVLVEPGFAIDPRGEEIEVCERVSLILPRPAGAIVVELLFAESLAGPVPAMPPEDGQRFSRVEEMFSVRLVPAVSAEGVPVARLAAARGRWRLDRTFQRPSARR